jgi:predicted DNA-binding transcriptional regulator YafY
MEATEVVQTGREIRMLYTNHRGETSVRRLVPQRIWFGKTDYHPDEQWLLEAYDLERQATRSYAVKDVRGFF